ncbi:MAG: sulfite exporter TauE/SafE family protein [Flavobacteriaceae bacterium]|nr:sulfite exporter TauE/SafE family protein [Flavobacteriaceae bacterium]
MTATTIIIIIIIGLLAGLFSGVLGVGGGVIMVPLMVMLLGFTQHQAQGTSLAVLAVPVTFLGAYNYYKAGNLTGNYTIDWKVALIMALLFVVGTYLGSKFAVGLDEKMLKKIFGGVLILVAIKMILGK